MALFGPIFRLLFKNGLKSIPKRPKLEVNAYVIEMELRASFGPIDIGAVS